MEFNLKVCICFSRKKKKKYIHIYISTRFGYKSLIARIRITSLSFFWISGIYFLYPLEFREENLKVCLWLVSEFDHFRKSTIVSNFRDTRQNRVYFRKIHKLLTLQNLETKANFRKPTNFYKLTMICLKF